MFFSSSFVIWFVTASIIGTSMPRINKFMLLSQLFRLKNNAPERIAERLFPSLNIWNLAILIYKVRYLIKECRIIIRVLDMC